MKKRTKKQLFTPKIGNEVTLLEVERARKDVDATDNDLIKAMYYDNFLDKHFYN